MKTLIILLIGIVLMSCGATQKAGNYEPQHHNIQGNPKYGYKFKADDTVWDKRNGYTYIIIKPFVKVQKKHGVLYWVWDFPAYYGKEILTGQVDSIIAERLLVKL